MAPVVPSILKRVAATIQDVEQSTVTVVAQLAQSKIGFPPQFQITRCMKEACSWTALIWKDRSSGVQTYRSFFHEVPVCMVESHLNHALSLFITSVEVNQHIFFIHFFHQIREAFSVLFLAHVLNKLLGLLKPSPARSV